jgi:hypothetical protein
MSIPRSDPLVFVGGAERSGTTLLRNMLNAHPALAVPDESPFVHQTHQRLARAGEQRNIEFAWRLIRESNRFRQWRLPAAEVQALLDRTPHHSYAELVRTLYAAYAHSRGKPHSGDKTTGNALRFTWLAELFPRSRFVHVVRDPRDVCMSRTVQIFNDGSLPGAARHWRAHVAAARAAARSLGERMIEIRYEQLVSEPRAHLEQLCAFIGIPFDSVMLEYGHEPDVLPRHGQDVHAREPVQQRLRSWREELTADDVSVIEFIAGELMDATGYPREVARLTPRAAETIARELADRGRRRWLQHGAPAMSALILGRRRRAA